MTQHQAMLHQIADVKWFEYKGPNAETYHAAVLSCAFKPEVNGDCWSCNRLKPVSLC